jgi:predicted HTH transcriptional regulator
MKIKNENRAFFSGVVYLKDKVYYQKNPNIEQIFTQIRVAEELGTGIKKYKNLQRHVQDVIMLNLSMKFYFLLLLQSMN